MGLTDFIDKSNMMVNSWQSTSMWWSGDVPHLQLEIDHEADVYYDQRDDYDQHQDKLLPLLVIVFSLLCTGVLMDVLPTEYLGNI